MKRSKFYQIATVDGVQELDFLNNNLNKFVMNYPASYYRVSESDLMRPDMISYNNYKTVNYWWIICLVNDIYDPFNDFKVGQLITIPSVLDIYDFVKKYTVAR
jgi:hypothetical protein